MTVGDPACALQVHALAIDVNQSARRWELAHVGSTGKGLPAYAYEERCEQQH
jgi:hypothetical protein